MSMDHSEQQQDTWFRRGASRLLLLFACALVGLAFVWFVWGGQLSAAMAGVEYVPDNVLVGYRKGVHITDLEKAVIYHLVNAKLKSRIDGLNVDCLIVPEGTVWPVIRILELHPKVAFAEPNYYRELVD